MVVAVATQPPSDAAKKSKTKAKARYLKKKKDRRKQRKAEDKHGGASAVVPHTPEPEANENTSSGSENEAESPVSTQAALEVKQPPHKRRKVDSNVEQDSEEHTSDSDSTAESVVAPHEEIPPRESRAKSPTSTVGLPSFPLPVAPDAPSKATLALQGLDKALLGAEVVDPSKTLSINALDTGRNLNAVDLPVVGEKMKKRLQELGITEFFAVQTALLPFLLPPQRRSRALYCPYDPPRDVCASAPTGSGKTLAYVVPIVEILSARIATRLRALVVLPTRDLVLQVHETFEAIAKGRGLKIGVVTGQHSFAHEQSQLVATQKDLQGGSSKIDILICTPGRLMDHINGTPGFTLQHLRFLVIDEADRLLAQSFQGWLAQVLNALRPPVRSVSDAVSSLSLGSSTLEILHHDALAPTFLPHIPTDYDDPKHSSCQKLLFSATLTRDPARIAALGLRDPKYFVVQGVADTKEKTSAAEAFGMEDFAMPAGLKEHYITTSTSRKPLMLFHLVHKRNVTNALVFTKSAESTARLVKLFEYFEEAYFGSLEIQHTERRRIIAQAYSSDLPPGERKNILERFKKQETDILVCSDLVARGMDIPHVTHVVSYDAPVDIRKYVHRAGRTARAGRAGDAWTLVEEQEAKFFKDMLRDAGSGRLERVARLRVRDAELKDMEESYDIALQKLKEAYSRNVVS
ncbi:DEAD-domain-containing protein [Sanghuangporus baumii]|uniref:ATP-dependent RNA helicase n=1 Tax=Sanghuangporus baumii TaxID=108892 RepID=A0A9Q5I1S3_SANBA|nr:DEAD-domain-containing protein [Sanghuangporus baumii]